MNSVREVGLSLRWLMIVPLVFALRANFTFASSWLSTVQLDSTLNDVLESMRSDSLQWVDPPFGEHIYITPGISKDLKLARSVVPWTWKGRELPEPRRLAVRGDLPEGGPFTVLDKIEDIWILERSDVHYAAVHTSDGAVPCKAEGAGGVLTVVCETDAPGTLILQEHMWPGWHARIDGERRQLEDGKWLALEAEPGSHTYEFRYQPLDVPIGIAVFFAGVGLGGYWLWHSRRTESDNGNEGAQGEAEV